MTGRRKLPPTMLGRADVIPPFLAWALASVGKQGPHPHPSPIELAKAAHMSLRTFSRIASKVTWANAKVKDVDAFLGACNVNLWDLSDKKKYLKRAAKKGHFVWMNKQQRQLFDRKFQEWIAAQHPPTA